MLGIQPLSRFIEQKQVGLQELVRECATANRQPARQAGQQRRLSGSVRTQDGALLAAIRTPTDVGQ
jgi:hypothetical protein